MGSGGVGIESSRGSGSSGAGDSSGSRGIGSSVAGDSSGARAVAWVGPSTSSTISNPTSLSEGFFPALLFLFFFAALESTIIMWCALNRIKALVGPTT